MEELLEKWNIVYKNIELYNQAVVHRSFINENPKHKNGHNERLEFLGDAVLELIVTDFIFAKYPNHPEGDMTSYRSSLVNAGTLSNVAINLDINRYMKLSKGESKETEITRARMSILADAYEAIIGAMYLDLGYEACNKWVMRTLLINSDEIIGGGSYRDPKSLVQEMCQDKNQLTPTYKVLEESGPDHDKLFIVGIYFGDKMVRDGRGKSKQLAEVDAARNALNHLGWM
jgi:ribonuclease III